MTILALLLLLATSGRASLSAATDPESGRRVYEEHCLECHGEEGRGDGPKSERLGLRPRDLSLGSFKCRCTPSAALPTDEDLVRTVGVGLPGTAMKGLGGVLDREQILAVVRYIKTLSPRFSTEEPPACIEIPEPPPDAERNAANGEQIYRALKCWNCHGVGGRGDGPAAGALVDEWGDKVRVFNFAAFGKFKCGGEPPDLYRTLHTGLSGSPMPSYTEAFLFAREDVEIVAALETVYDSGSLEPYGAWARTQPDRSTLAALPEAARRSLVQERTWDLIAYLRTLLRR